MLLLGRSMQGGCNHVRLVGVEVSASLFLASEMPSEWSGCRMACSRHYAVKLVARLLRHCARQWAPRQTSS